MIRNVEGYTEELKELRQLYRNCFKQHPEVLHHLLADLGTYSEIPADPGAVALRNYGIRILDIIGVNDESIIQDVIRRNLELPFTPNKQPQEE